MEKNKEKQAIKKRPPQRWSRLGIMAELAFLLTGVALTLVAYLFLNIFIEKLVHGDHERVSENTVGGIVREFSDLEGAINAAGLMIAQSGEQVNDETLRTAAKLDPAIQKFDQLLYLYESNNGKWEYKNIFKAPDAAYAIQLNQKTLNLLRYQGSVTVRTRILTDDGLFQSAGDGNAPAVGARPFALIHPVSQDRLEGLLIGISHSAAVLGPGWHGAHSEVLGLRIRDMQGERDMLEVTRSDISADDSVRRSYEFSFASGRWEVRVDYVQDQKTLLLMALPYFVVFFGFILTTAGTLYIHGSQRQTLRISAANMALEEKNKELRQEMSKRERLHKVLKRSEAEHRSLIDSVSDIIFETDISGKILYLNATWEKITGFAIDEFRGQDLFGQLHPQDQDRQRKDFYAFVHGETKTYRSLTRLRAHDGGYRAVELAFYMIHEDQNKEQRVLGTLTDVEERRRAERALGEVEKKYRTIVENAANGIFQLGADGVYVSANPAMARILGYIDQEDLLRTVRNANEDIYFNSRERQYFLKDLESAGSIQNYETQVRRKDGTRIWVNESARVVRDEHGAVLYYEGSIEDVTQRKETEISLRETKIHSDLANRAKSEFLANMSHELRTPLNSIIGFSEIIKSETFGPLGQNAYKEYANDIYESGKKLLSVINEILDISRIEAGERLLNDQIVDLNTLAGNCVNMLSNKARANNIIVSNMLRDVPQIVGEELAIKQVLLNLLSNAIKFTPSGGRVTITNDMDVDGNLRISITDTGIGLDESEVQKALSPFGQIHSELSRNNAGTGLGLTLAQALVKLHDGKLELFSQKGIGTTVTIMIPADRVQQVKPVPKTPSAQDAANPDKTTS